MMMILVQLRCVCLARDYETKRMLDYAFSFSFLSSKEVTPDRPAKHTQSTKHPEPERHVCAIR